MLLEDIKRHLKVTFITVISCIFEDQLQLLPDFWILQEEYLLQLHNSKPVEITKCISTFLICFVTYSNWISADDNSSIAYTWLLPETAKLVVKCNCLKININIYNEFKENTYIPKITKIWADNDLL